MLRPVSDPLEVHYQLFGGIDLTDSEVLRSGENLGGVLQHPARETTVNFAGILDVEVSEDAGTGEKDSKCNSQDGEAEDGSPKTLLNTNTQRNSHA